MNRNEEVISYFCITILRNKIIMNSKQSAIYSMLRRTSDLLKRNQSLTIDLPTFSSLESLLDEKSIQIGILCEQHEEDLSVLKKHKDELRVVATQKVLDIIRRIVAYAKIMENEVLAQKVNFSEASMARLSDNEFVSACSIVYTVIEENASPLIMYGITLNTLDTLKTAIDAFKAAMYAPKKEFIEMKQTTDKLTRLFAEEESILEKLDVLVEILQDSQPAFYNEYQDTRKLTSPGILSKIADVFRVNE
jgi:hypothetical protein